MPVDNRQGPSVAPDSLISGSAFRMPEETDVPDPARRPA
jgi:hypothetical protein